MSKFVKLIVNILDNLIQINNNDITIIKDNNNKIWFSINQIFRALGYKNIKAEIHRHSIDSKYIKNYKEIYNELPNDIKLSINHPKNFQFTMIMTDETGIYFILNKSRKEIAKQFRDELLTNILPTLRETGKYKFNQSDRNKLEKINKKLQQTTQKIKLYQQEIKLTKKLSHTDKTGKGFIYVLKIKTIQDGQHKTCYKIGYTANLEKRLATYRTGNPDIELAHQENVKCNKKQLETCILNLNILKRLKNKSEVICDVSLDKIKEEIADCKKLLEKHSSQ